MSRPADEAKNGLIARTLAFASRPSARFSLGALVISGGIAAILFWVGYPPSAATQPVIPGGDDLRAVYATAADVVEGKRLADASCASCHGANGISTTADVPHLAGQRPAYLHLELRAYQSGARGDNAMSAAVKFLSDDALLKAAAFYAEPRSRATTRCND